MPYSQSDVFEILGNYVLHGLGFLYLLIDFSLNQMQFPDIIPFYSFLYALFYLLVMILSSLCGRHLYMEWKKDEWMIQSFACAFVYLIVTLIWYCLKFANFIKT